MKFLTAGESHGKSLIGIIEEFPSGLKIDLDCVDHELSRRQKGFGRGGRMSIESDRAEIISGIRGGMSTGSPISFIIRNKDWENWKDIMETGIHLNTGILAASKDLNPRPGHADLTGLIKYRLKDIRDVLERSSARETAVRVCVGAFAKIALRLLGIEIYSYVVGIGKAALRKKIIINTNTIEEIENSDLRCPDKEVYEKMKEEILAAKENGDSIGGKFTIIATGVPAGLGSYTQWDRRIDGNISRAIMSIPAIKALEIGDGYASSEKTGLQFHDEIHFDGKKGFYRRTNRAGGIEGGMTNGENITITASMKPIPTTSKGLKTVNIETKKSDISLKERSDICAVPSASIVGEAMLAIEIFNAVQHKFGNDNMDEISNNYKSHLKYIRNI